MGDPVGFGANLFAAYSVFKGPSKLAGKLNIPSKRPKTLGAGQARGGGTAVEPLLGHSLSVRRMAVEEDLRPSVRPEEGGIPEASRPAKPPSGTIYSPPMGRCRFIHAYMEAAAWTAYAAPESGRGLYEARKPGGFLSIDIRSAFPTAMAPLPSGLPAGG